MDRREYQLEITINKKTITKVIIDPHYEEKHGEAITDDLILVLVKLLDGGNYIPQAYQGPYEYFAREDLKHEGKTYRLIWLLEEDKLYIGVVNAFRRK